ncbi:MAG: RluA family pseudouridine synthase [Eubacterium sp.]|nr:RluA family pseudouridine synthase [Eubacterium sp.]
MEAERFVILADEGSVNERIDSVIAGEIEGLSRSRVQTLIDEGAVIVSGVPCLSKKYKVKAGDRIEILVEPVESLVIEPENILLDIRYEDDDVIVVNKPQGMVVHPAVGNLNGTLVNALLYHCGDHLSDLNGPVRPGIVHRIDKDTSGLILAAKNNAAHEALAEQFFYHTITRTYIALVRDNIKEDDGTIDLPIGRDPSNRFRRCVNGANPKNAVTHYKVLERFGDMTLVSCELETGRTHQIRVHMAHIKHPVVGDALYGPRKTRSTADGQFLHAAVLGFDHPTTGEYMVFTAALPDRFLKMLESLRKSR